MATPTARAKQRAEAVQRVVDSATSLAEILDVDPPDIPMSHRDIQYLPTLQLEAVATFIDEVAAAVDEPPAAKTTTTPKPKTKDKG